MIGFISPTAIVHRELENVSSGRPNAVKVFLGVGLELTYIPLKESCTVSPIFEFKGVLGVGLTVSIESENETRVIITKQLSLIYIISNIGLMEHSRNTFNFRR
jgi:hypothetical protein